MTDGDVTKRLMNLLDEAAFREEEYAKIVKKLNEQKAAQASQYLQKLQKIYQMTLAVSEKKNAEPQYRNVNLRHVEALKDKRVRDFRKVKYTIDNIQKFYLNIEIRFLSICFHLDDYLSEYYPKEIEIRFHFYQQDYNSGRLIYSNVGRQDQLTQLLSNREPFSLINQVERLPIFEIQLRHETIQRVRRTIEFMERDCLNVEIWDANLKMLFGECKVPLKQLLFYQKDEDIWVQEFQIFSQLRDRQTGSINVEFRNSKSGHHTATSTDKTKIYSKEPMQLSSTLDYDIHSVSEKESRLLRRINKYKDSVDVTINQEMQKRRLDQALKIKQEQIAQQTRNKVKYSEQIASKMQHKDECHECPQGRPHILTLELTNSLVYGEKYTFKIEGIDNQDITIVSDPREWQFFCKEYGYDQPSRFTIISKQSCYLMPKESITVLFKYLSFAKGRADKEIRLTAYDGQNETAAKASYSIQPVEPTIDHVFRVYDFYDNVVALDIPVDLSEAPGVFTTNKDMQYLFNKNRLSIKVKVTKSYKFTLFVYSDSRLSQLKYSYCVQVNAYPKCMTTLMPLGREQTVKLELPPMEEDTSVAICTTNQAKCWIIEGNKMMLQADTVNFITAVIRSLEPQPEKIVVFCRRDSDGAVVGSWLIKLDLDKVEYKAVIEVVCSTEKQTTKNVEISNPKSKKGMFGILSSNLTYVQVVKTKREMHAHEATGCELTILPHRQQTKQVILSVSDKEQTVTANYLLRLIYSSDYKQQ